MSQINLHHGDCMEAMRSMPDKAYDLAIVDPPYGIGAPEDNYPSVSTADRLKKNRLNSGSGKLKNRVLNQSNASWDIQAPTDEYFKELFRVSENQIICGGNYFGLPRTRGVGCWENFSIWTSFDCPAWIFRHSNTGGANAEKKIHPTQKPIALYKYLLSKFTSARDRILDTHGGSMSIAIACYDMGFDLDLWEIDAEYYRDGVKRFESHKAQTRLFTPQQMYT